jgi:hypothetical protein
MFTFNCRGCGETNRSVGHPLTHNNLCLACDVLADDPATPFEKLPPFDPERAAGGDPVLLEIVRLQKNVDGLERAVQSLFHACVLAREAVHTGAVGDKAKLLEWLDRAMALGLTQGEYDDLDNVKGWVNLRAEAAKLPEGDFVPVLF